MKPNWVKDVESFIDNIPYGRVTVDIDRVNNHTTQISTIGAETLRYVDNQECLDDIVSFLKSLLDEGHSGNVQFGVDMKHGQITLLTIKNIKKTQY